MAIQEKSGYCKSCQKNVLMRRQGTNHILHLLLSIVTCGFWVIIWILTSIKVGGWKCPNCGGNATKKGSSAFGVIFMLIVLFFILFCFFYR